MPNLMSESKSIHASFFPTGLYDGYAIEHLSPFLFLYCVVRQLITTTSFIGSATGPGAWLHNEISSITECVNKHIITSKGNVLSWEVVAHPKVSFTGS
jgi:hypothetical protein